MIYFLWYVALSYPFMLISMYCLRREFDDIPEFTLFISFLLSPILPAFVLWRNFMRLLGRR